jgi:hypothetical protein
VIVFDEIDAGSTREDGYGTRDVDVAPVPLRSISATRVPTTFSAGAPRLAVSDASHARLLRNGRGPRRMHVQ